MYDEGLDFVYLGTGTGRRGTAIRAARAGATICTSRRYWRCERVTGSLCGTTRLRRERTGTTTPQPLMLADLLMSGGTRKVILQASKNDFSMLDRQTGQFISAKAFVKSVTWNSDRSEDWSSN